MSSTQIINDVTPRTQAIASSSQSQFDTNWTANAATDILVYARASGVDADDATQLVSSSDYTVTFIGGDETVRVTFLSGRTAGDIITIVRDTPADRLNLYSNTNFTASMLNEDVGILTLVDQQNQMYDSNFCPHYNLSATFDIDSPADLILPILPAGYMWAKNSNDTAIEAIEVPSSGTATGAINTGLQNQLTWYAANGTTVSGLPTSASSILRTNASGEPAWSGAMTDGQLLIGDTSGTPTAATITAGAGITITNGAGSITITFSGRVIGQIIDFGAASLPTNFLLCDGTAVSRTTYAALFAVIGTTWGVGDGSTTFNLPDLRRRTAIGSGGSGSGTIGNAVGNTGGEETHTMTTAELVAHTHTFANATTPGSIAVPGAGSGFGTGTTSSTGSTTPFNVMQPSAVVYKCICYQ